jgi:hypothetical protein
VTPAAEPGVPAGAGTAIGACAEIGAWAAISVETTPEAAAGFRNPARIATNQATVTNTSPPRTVSTAPPEAGAAAAPTATSIDTPSWVCMRPPARDNGA